MHIIAAKAVCFKEAMEPGFVEYQRQIVANAQRLARGLSSAGFRLVSGGTDNHLMLVDVFSKGLTGKVAEAALGKAGITVNKNAIPFDKNPPMVASGIRVGTPAITSRGMREPEMDLDRRLHRARARVAGQRRRARIDTRRSRGAVPEVPAVSGTVKSGAGTATCTPRSRRRSRRADRSHVALPGFEARNGQLEMAERGVGRVRRRRRAARRSWHRHRQDARLSHPRDPQPPPRPRFDRHQEPSGTDLL